MTDPLKVDVDLVLVPVLVTDERDRIVIGLQKDNFDVYDGTEQQVIRHFSSEDAPISLGVICDISSSMSQKIENARKAVSAFLRSANPQDEVFLLVFHDRPKLLVDFTSSVEEIESGISKVTADGTTALLDAVYLGLAQMKKARNEKKILLIVSDGGDNHSRYTASELLSVVRESGVQICAMGIFDEAPRTKAARTGPDLLAAITDITGGRTFPIHSLKKIGDVASKLAIELRNQYLIAFRPSKLAHDGKWHRIGVRVAAVQNPLRLRIYAEAGYYAPAQ